MGLRKERKKDISWPTGACGGGAFHFKIFKTVRYSSLSVWFCLFKFLLFKHSFLCLYTTNIILCSFNLLLLQKKKIKAKDFILNNIWELAKVEFLGSDCCGSIWRCLEMWNGDEGACNAYHLLYYLISKVGFCYVWRGNSSIGIDIANGVWWRGSQKF